MLNDQFSTNLTPDSLFKLCYTRYEKLTFFVIRKVAPNLETAQDLHQDFWMMLFLKKERLYQVYQEGANLKSYLCRAAKNKAIDYQRKQSDVILMEEKQLVYWNNQQVVNETTNEQHNFVKYSSWQEWLPYLLHRLPLKQQVVIKLQLNGYSYQAIAEELSLTLTAVTRRLYNAKQNLKSWIKT